MSLPLFTSIYNAIDRVRQSLVLPRNEHPLSTVARALASYKDGKLDFIGTVRTGTATLVAGTVTVADTSVTANTQAILTAHGVTNAGSLGVTYTAGTGLTIASSSNTDVRVVDYILVERAS